MIRMARLIDMPSFNGIELGKVMADTRRTAFRPVGESHGYTESPPVPRSDSNQGDVAPETGMMTSDADTISMDQAKKLFKAMKLDKTKVRLDQFHQGLNVELEHNDVTHGDLKKIALIALAHLAEDPAYYTKLSQVEESDRIKNDPCWKGYKMVGQKKKNGRDVPNCVPENRMPLMGELLGEDKPAKGKKWKTNGVSHGEKGVRISPGTSRGDAYCARSYGIKGNWKNDPNSPNRLSRKKWKCRGKKSMK